MTLPLYTKPCAKVASLVNKGEIERKKLIWEGWPKEHQTNASVICQHHI